MVSVIVPVYNIENNKKHFLEAVESIRNQSYKDLEIVLVNDGSTDASKEILLSLQTEDSRINVVNKENGGVESARREGIANASGDFVFHMDQDDLLDGDAISKLIEYADREAADVVVGCSRHFSKNTSVGNEDFSFDDVKILNHEEFVENYYVGFFGKHKFPVQIWNKLYRTAFIKSLGEIPRTGLYNEDLNYNLNVLYEASKIVWIPDVTYFYRFGGFTTKKIKDLDKVAISCYEIKREKIVKYSLPDEFDRLTKIELLNYINSSALQEATFGPKEELAGYIEKIFAMPQMKEAIELVKNDSYRNPHVEFMINYDAKGYRSYLLKKARQSKVKNVIKRMI